MVHGANNPSPHYAKACAFSPIECLRRERGREGERDIPRKPNVDVWSSHISSSLPPIEVSKLLDSVFRIVVPWWISMRIRSCLFLYIYTYIYIFISVLNFTLLLSCIQPINLWKVLPSTVSSVLPEWFRLFSSLLRSYYRRSHVVITFDECSRLKPSDEFHFKGLSNVSSSVEPPVQIQDVNPRL